MWPSCLWLTQACLPPLGNHVWPSLPFSLPEPPSSLTACSSLPLSQASPCTDLDSFNPAKDPLISSLNHQERGGESRRELKTLRKGYGYLILQIKGWKIRGFVKGSDSTAFLERVKLQPHETSKLFLYFLGKEASYSLSWITFLLRLLHPDENSCLLLFLKLYQTVKLNFATPIKNILMKTGSDQRHRSSCLNFLSLLPTNKVIFSHKLYSNCTAAGAPTIPKAFGFDP